MCPLNPWPYNLSKVFSRGDFFAESASGIKPVYYTESANLMNRQGHQKSRLRSFGPANTVVIAQTAQKSTNFVLKI